MYETVILVPNGELGITYLTIKNTTKISLSLTFLTYYAVTTFIR